MSEKKRGRPPKNKLEVLPKIAIAEATIQSILLQVGALEKSIEGYFKSVKLQEINQVDQKRLQDIGSQISQINEDFEMHLIDIDEEGESLYDDDEPELPGIDDDSTDLED